MTVRTKRVYEEPSEGDGTRVLVDRLWPRGVSKADADLDDWLKTVAPSDELREWFDHDPEKWDEFRERYHEELTARNETEEPLTDLRRIADEGTLTLVYAAKGETHNNAVALKEMLESG